MKTGKKFRTDIQKSIGNLLRTEREKRGISLQLISQELGVNAFEIKKTEMGYNRCWHIYYKLFKYYKKNIIINLA